MKTVAVINRYAAWIVAMIFMIYWISMMAYSQMEWIFPSFAKGISHDWQGIIWLIGWLPFVLIILWVAAAESGYAKFKWNDEQSCLMLQYGQGKQRFYHYGYSGTDKSGEVTIKKDEH